jgi:hypothetical protein
VSSVFDRVLTAPTPDELEKALRSATRAVGGYDPTRPAWAPGPADLRKCLATAEGVRQWDDGESEAVAVVWWHDLLGRPHLRLVGWQGGLHDGRAFDEAPPLALLRPEQALVRPGGAVLLLCGCGACGGAAELGWMGDRCGPCFDRGDDAPRPAAAGWEVGGPGQVVMVALSPDGGALAALNKFGRVTVWDVATGAKRGSVLTNARVDFTLVVGPAGRLVATRYGRPEPDRAFGIWDVEGDRRLDFVETDSDLAFAADGRTFYTGTLSDELAAFTLGGRGSVVLPGMGQACLLVSRFDGAALAARDWIGRSVAVWDVSAQALAGRYELPAAAQGLAFAPDGRLYAVLEGDDGDLLSDVPLFDVAHGAPVAQLNLSPGRALMAFGLTPGSRALFTLTDRLQGWSLADGGGAAATLFEGLAWAVDGAAVLPDGRLLTFSRRDGRVRIWPAEVFRA